MSRRGLRVGVVAVLCALVAAGTAQAGTDTVQDGNDRPGPLDIRSVSQGHSGTKVTHTIRTFANWPIGLLGPGTPNFFSVDISTDADPTPERVIVIFSSGGRLIAGAFTRRGAFVGRVGASRPNAHTVKLTIRRAHLGSPAGYRWQAESFFRSPGPCGGGCTDRAPRVLHDLRAPTVVFPLPTPVSTTYNLDFTVRDGGGAGLASWRLEQRDVVTTPGPWTLRADGVGTGPQSIPFTDALPGDIDQFRVVAVDGHGNRTISPIRQVTAPR